MLGLRECYRGGYDGRPGWWMKLRLDDGWREDVDEFKRRIPSEERAWDAAAELWWVSQEYALRLCGLVANIELYLQQPALF
jgi:hypothetical protein